MVKETLMSGKERIYDIDLDLTENRSLSLAEPKVIPKGKMHSRRQRRRQTVKNNDDSKSAYSKTMAEYGKGTTFANLLELIED